MDVVNNIEWSEKPSIEVGLPTTQQMNSFDCGLHVLINTKHVL